MKQIGTKLCIALCCVILFGLTWMTCASGGDASDPVISLSYLSNRIHATLSQQASERVNAMGGVSIDDLNAKRNEALGKLSNAGLIGAAADLVLENLQANGKYLSYSDTVRFITLRQDDVISGAAGTQIILRSGVGRVINNPVIDVTNGFLLAAGKPAALNIRYMLPARDWSGIRITSPSATVGVQGFYRVVSIAYKPQYTDLAQALKTMGLFQGTTTGFNLGKSATRAEAATMLIRLLGEEDVAQSKNYRHPFTDVPAWANGYVGHAYAQGYTKGTSANRFTPDSPVSATQYMTFLLRALGYDDAAGDFTWDNALSAAVKYGIITQNEKDTIAKGGFYRDQMVYLSYYALFAKRKGSDQTLLAYLQSRGVVSQVDAASAIARVSRAR